MAAIDRLNFSKAFLGSYVIGILVALHLVGIAAVSHRLRPLLPERPIRYLASFTFALYLFHYPLLFFFAAVVDSSGMTTERSFLVPIATLLTVWALGYVTERRKATVKRWVTASFGAVARSGRRCLLALASSRR